MSKNYEIECAIVELEKELLELKRKRQKTETPHDAVETVADESEGTANQAATEGDTQEPPVANLGDGEANMDTDN